MKITTTIILLTLLLTGCAAGRYDPYYPPYPDTYMDDDE